MRVHTHDRSLDALARQQKSTRCQGVQLAAGNEPRDRDACRERKDGCEGLLGGPFGGSRRFVDAAAGHRVKNRHAAKERQIGLAKDQPAVCIVRRAGAKTRAPRAAARQTHKRAQHERLGLRDGDDLE